eukprot:14251842-Heterocapsa_arctica.AAC.1
MSFRITASCALPQHTIYVFPDLCVCICSTAVCLEAICDMNSLVRASAIYTGTMSQTAAAQARKTSHPSAG